MKLTVNLPQSAYDIHIGSGLLQKAGELLNLNRKVLIVTDEGVPPEYAARVAAAAKTPTLVTIPQGEGSKQFPTYEKLLLAMLEAGFGRGDCVVAVGGGVVGDLAGFVAASFMRGVDFYNLPTTLLSQVDSSVGGKTAINLGHIKNIVGAFWQPKKVLIDTDTLKTLPPRQIASGMAEVIKMSLTSDAELFAMMEAGEEDYATLIARALQIKISVVEQDERESGLRKILNFGHTIGHGIESVGNGAFYHGECVAMGMLPMCGESVRARLLPVLARWKLPIDCKMDTDAVYAAMLHDKKAQSGKVTVVKVPKPGSFTLETVEPETLLPGIKDLAGN